jgi:sulfur carrier protein
MNILLNNRKESFDKNTLSIRDIMNIKAYTYRSLIVKINGRFVKKEEYETTYVTDGDHVDIIHMISGG